MSICKNCGVDLGEGNDRCPLCDPTETEPGKIKSPADLFSLSRKETSRHLFEITILLLVSGIIITVAIDAVFGRGMSWSLISTTCIGYVIAMVSGIYFFARRPYLMLTLTGAATLVFLWLIDILTGDNPVRCCDLPEFTVKIQGSEPPGYNTAGTGGFYRCGRVSY